MAEDNGAWSAWLEGRFQAAGVSQEDVARRLDTFSQSRVSRGLNGLARLSDAEKTALLRALVEMGVVERREDARRVGRRMEMAPARLAALLDDAALFDPPARCTLQQFAPGAGYLLPPIYEGVVSRLLRGGDLGDLPLSAPVAAVWGAPGAGKTLLVQRVAFNERLRDRYGGILYGSLRGTDLDAVARGWQSALGLTPQGGAAGLAALRRLWAGRPTLYILDDVSEVEAAQAAVVGTADIPEDQLIGGLMRLSQNPDARPARLIEYLSNRAGLLLPRGVGVYTFPHRTFQEYLAACYLTDCDYPDRVAELARADPNRWREVALLAGAKAARGTASAIWGLVDALCFHQPEADASQPLDDAWGALLAGQALVESADLEAVSARNRLKVACVQANLVHLLQEGQLPAVERAAAGNALAQVGDGRFRADAWHLPDEPLLGLVEIPAGPFLMGSDDGYDDEQPQHPVSLSTFYIARYPTTVAQFRAFVEQSGYKPRDPDCLRGIDNHPVVSVTWHDALAYCRWLTGQLKAWPGAPAPLASLLREGWQVRLPSEAEWEKAARGPLPDPPPLAGEGAGWGRIYPWGDEPDPDRANYSDTGIGATSAVGCFPGGASPYGVLDLSGNVWEWCSSLYKDYPYRADDGREDLNADGYRVWRGGAFHYTDDFMRCSARYLNLPDYWGSSIGFRVMMVSPSFRSGL